MEEDEHGGAILSSEFSTSESGNAPGNDDAMTTDKGADNEIRSVIRPSNITYEEMAAAGLMAKRILDQGRVEFLREMGLNARQLQYCDPELSPECMLILATRS
jgi:hypothetical protein